VDEVKEIIDTAKKLMLRDGYHAPMVFAKGTKSKAVVVLECFGSTADERAKDMLYAGAMVADKRNVGELELIVFVNEAWMGRNVDVLPSLDPKRVEVLMINSLDARTQEEDLIAFEVVRNNQQTVVDLKQVVLPGKGSAKGKLLPAFQKGYEMISPVLN
jgi:hypothetical protein